MSKVLFELFHAVQRDVLLVKTPCLASTDYRVKSFWKILSSKFIQNLIQHNFQFLLYIDKKMPRLVLNLIQYKSTRHNQRKVFFSMTVNSPNSYREIENNPPEEENNNSHGF